MKQSVKKLETLSETEIKQLMTERFLDAMEGIINMNVVKNERQFASALHESQNKISKLKMEGRYINVDVISKAVNFLGMDANNLFMLDKDPAEKPIRDSAVINGAVSGRNNKNTNNIAQGGGNIVNNYTAEQIIQGLPDNVREDLKKQFNSMTSEIKTLKKTIAQFEKTLADKEEIIALKDELLNVYRKKK